MNERKKERMNERKKEKKKDRKKEKKRERKKEGKSYCFPSSKFPREQCRISDQYICFNAS